MHGQPEKYLKGMETCNVKLSKQNLYNQNIHNMNIKSTLNLRVLLLSMLAILANSVAWEIYAQDAKWTVMVYLDGDNNLEEAAVANLNEMETVGSSASVNIVVQFDRIDGFDDTNGDWTDTRRFKILHDDYPDSITSPAVAVLGELNMGDPQTLSDFIIWSVTGYPADHYALILSDHGNGWMKAGRHLQTDTLAEKAVCDDLTNNDFLSNAEVSTAIREAGKYLDLIAYEACLMAMIEVTYQNKDLADIMVASEAGGLGEYTYTAFLKVLTQHPEMSADRFAGYIVDTYGDYHGCTSTQSATDLTRIGNITGQLDVFTQAIMDADNLWDTVGTVREGSLRFSDLNNEYYYDLGDFASRVSETVHNPTVKQASLDLIDSINSVVLYNYFCPEISVATGLSIYFPSILNYSLAYQEENAGRDFADSTNWDEFLQAFYSHIHPESISQGESLKRIGIYPNPASDYLMVNFNNGIFKSAQIELLDISGKILYTAKMGAGMPATYTINLTSLEEGIYLIQISTPDYTVTNKVIKME
jgi:hypothetical protein